MIVEPAKKEWTIPGPQVLPLIGRTIDSLRFASNSIKHSNKLFQKYGRIVSLAAGGRTNLYSSEINCPGSILVYGPEMVRQVTTQHNIYHKHPLTRGLYRLKDRSQRTAPLKRFLVGLFGVNEEKHLEQRKLMMPAFRKQKIESYCDSMIKIANLEFDRLEDKKAIELNKFMQRLTLQIATKTLFGENLDGKNLTSGEILQKILILQTNPLLELLPFDFPGFPFSRYLNLLDRFEVKMKAMILEKKSKRGEESDLLSMLIEACDRESGLKLTQDELIANTGVIFTAGHETTANALTWILFFLSQHHKVAADLQDELESVLKGEAPSVEKLESLPLLERVIKEGIRILPPVPWNARITSQITKLNDYTIPKGSEVFVSIYQTHHLPEIYSNPESFKPERWETIKPTIYEYNPFSAGPRICIGADFAMIEMKIILATILQKFRLEFIDRFPIDLSGLISIKPKYGITMLVHKQDRQFNVNLSYVRGNVREVVNLP